MGRIIKISNSIYQYVIIEGKVYGYNPHSARLNKYFNIDKLLVDKLYYQEVSRLGYIYFEKDYWINETNKKSFDIFLSENFIEFFKLNWSKDSFYDGLILLTKRLCPNDIESFYDFSLDIEIDGIRTSFFMGCNLDIVHIEMPYQNDALESKMTAVFGEPQIPTDIGEIKYSSYHCYILPISRIDKIIGIKRYKDISSLGQEDGEQFTGEVEETILDLHNFDEDIYKIFEEHGMLEIER